MIRTASTLGAALCFSALVALAQPAAAAVTEVSIDPKAAPENLTMAPDGALIFGSAGGPHIYRAKPGAAAAEPWIDVSADGDARFLGVLADGPSNTLWACEIIPVPNTTRRASQLRGFDLKSGAAKFRWALPGDNNTCNDASVGPDKALYVSDTANGRIYRLKPGAAEPELLIEHRALFGVDGITFMDGVLYVNSVTANNLYRVPLDATGKAGEPVDIWMDQPIKGPDGMRAARGHIYVAENRNGRVSMLTVTGDKASVTLVKDGIGSTTAVEPFGDTLWILDRTNNRAFSVPMPK